MNNMTFETLAQNNRIKLQQSMITNLNERIIKARRVAVADKYGLDNEEHRMEYVATIRGVKFINDSKATNVNATWYSFETISEPFIWIVGGEDKKNDYSPLKSLVEKKVKAIICLSNNNKKILENFSHLVPIIVKTFSIESAATSAFCLAEPGYSVLFSPASPSFDMFDNYEDRGKQFKNAVNQL